MSPHSARVNKKVRREEAETLTVIRCRFRSKPRPPCPCRINGLEYDLNRIDFRVPFDVTERWRFQTGGNAPHPVHVHGASFQVVSRTGGRGKLFAWEGGWKDTVLLNDREAVDVLIRFDGYRGLYVMHCHQLEHESMGMMSNFEVF